MNRITSFLYHIVLLSILVFGYVPTIFGQSYPSWGNLKEGKYKVGFKTIKTYDSSRLYKPEQNIKYRPLLIHLWYPTHSSKSDYLTYKSYIALETQRERFAKDSIHIINRYCQQNMYGYIDFGKKLMGNLNTTIEDVLSSSTAARENAEILRGHFPLIIYAPSFGKSSIQNNIVCEYLASHGYFVVSVASAGEYSQIMTGDEKGVLSQVKDIEFVVNYLKNIEKTPFSNIGTFGYSWGGFSNIIFQMRNDYVKAIASWDGSVEYQGYEVAQKMIDFKPEKVTVPYLFFSNQNEDWTKFPFFKSVKSDRKYLFRMKKLEHAEFTSYWTVFTNAKTKASTYDLESYKALCTVTLTFFDIYLKGMKSKEKSLNDLSSDIIMKLKIE